MLRAVNVGGTGLIKMEELRALYAKLKFRDVESYVQSGNLVFVTDEKNLATIATTIDAAIEKKFGHKARTIVRSTAQMRAIVARNPFAGRRDIEPGKLVVHFLPRDPGADVRANVLKVPSDPEELVMVGSEIYIYFPNGQGRPKIKWAHVEKALGTPGTSRNWNSVTKLLAMAEAKER